VPKFGHTAAGVHGEFFTVCDIKFALVGSLYSRHATGFRVQ
jgi:hypothetical protein